VIATETVHLKEKTMQTGHTVMARMETGRIKGTVKITHKASNYP
jgi:hypothetical protein